MPDAPNNGPAHGRFRNTMKATVRRADPFPLDPSEVGTFGRAKRDLWYSHKIAMAGLKAQAQMVRGQYKFARQQTNAEARGAIAQVSGDMAERGMVGSTVQAVANQGVAGARDAALAQGFMDRQQSLLGINQSRLEAVAQLRMGLSDIAMQRAELQRRRALQAFGSGGQNPWGY